jgi:hypothetical protein
MKLNTLMIGLLIGFLVACDRTQTNSKVQSTPQPQKVDVTKPIPKSSKNVAKAAQPTGDQQSQDKKADNVVGADNSPSAIGKAAKLTPLQVQDLISLEKKRKIRVIVPTYIPAGFKVDSFKINSNRFGPYSIIYRNSSDACFHIVTPPWGDGPIEYDTVRDISSPALGKIVLGYTQFPQSDSFPVIGFRSPAKEGFFFASPASYAGCKSISFKDAIKIIESLQYLNP